MFLSLVRQYHQTILLLIIALLVAVQLSGCQSSNFMPYLVDAEGNLVLDGEGKPILMPAERSLLDRIEFDDDESGCVQIIGQIDLNSSLFFSSNTQIILKKTKVIEGQEELPEC